MTIKAIETKYKGHRFRSCLEARWAVFFDALGIKWEYEKEGFDLGKAGLYLPDFWLPEQRVWVEIKAESPTENETEKAHALAQMSDHDVFIFYGLIPDPTDVGSKSESAHLHCADEGWDCYYCWCQCSHCGSLGIQFDGRSDRLPCRRRGECSVSSHGDKGYNYDNYSLVKAYTVARSARFEHGESGA